MASSAFPPVFPPLQLRSDLLGRDFPTNSLKSLDGHEIADGGIRDNLGIEYYLSTMKLDASPQPAHCIVSDAGLYFDWSDKTFVEQTAGNWLARLLRTVDIQMMRLWDCDLSKASNPIHLTVGHSLKAPYVVDRKLQVFAQPLTQKVASRAAKTPTDLQPVSEADRYAVVRLGYDAIAFQRRILDSERPGLPDGDFWHALLPENISAMNSEDGGISLEDEITGSSRPQFDGYIDFLHQTPQIVPTVWKQRIVEFVLAIVLVVVTVFVCWMIWRR